ncbi:methyltransferase domain-containing protein [Streptomyces sp. NPDC041068]|uniref:methyltransferase domain-containing protein n=1 Tax=Streptomyces sp. NPDC041068 TaxID=3155130 RepID=UPI0033DEEBFE
MSEYLMEDAREAGRLAEKVDAPGWVRAHLSHVMSPRAAVLDVGAGPGHLADAVLCRWPQAHVVALDGSAERLAAGASRPGDSGPRRCCAHACHLPFVSGTFDVVYARLLLQYVAQRGAAVREMARVTRPGGAVVLFDLDGQLMWHDPLPAELGSLLARIRPALSAAGFDPNTGRSLYRLAREAGLRGITVRVEPYHLIAGRADAAERARWELKLDIARPFLHRALGSQAAADRAASLFLDFLDDENTLTYCVAFTVTGLCP